MALTLLSRPQGHKLATALHDAVIYDDGAGNVIVYAGTAHGMADGDFVYIESNFDSYNGFKYVDAIAYDYFKIRDSETSDYVPFVQEAEISFYISVLQHAWQCVHLPIVYELESSLSPNNIAEETYVPITIVSQANIDGFTRLNLTGALSYPHELSFIELIGDGPLAGKYQMVNIAYPWSVDIDLAYDASNVFTGYQVVRYYDNYFATVNVYAGFESGHRWESVKPFELAATLKLIPDSNNKIKFSIAEILRGYIDTRNNLTLDTLPNNTDFHVSFYISYSENYDIGVDGEYVISVEEDVTTDEFTGHAVNAMLPFKSLNMSFLSEYVDGSGILARWLTTQERPVAVVGHFFDLSFLLQYIGFDVEVTINKYWLGVVTDTEVITIENPGSGVIRVPFIPESGYDQYCIQAASVGGVPTPIDLSTFVNSGAGVSWTLGSQPSIFLDSIESSKILSDAYPFGSGEYTVTITYAYSGLADVTLNLTTYTASFIVLDSTSQVMTPISPPSQNNGTLSLTFGGFGVDRIGMSSSDNDLAVENTLTILSMTILSEGSEVTTPITEQICIDIIEECGNTFTNDELRLTEDTDLRRLE